jgi:hypothetical protein
MITCPYVGRDTAYHLRRPRPSEYILDRILELIPGNNKPRTSILESGAGMTRVRVRSCLLFLGLDRRSLGFRFYFQRSAFFRLGLFRRRNNNQQLDLATGFFNRFNRCL